MIRPNEGKQVWLGSRIGSVLKILGEETGRSFSTLELTITPSSIMIPRTHSREDEVTFVIEGEVGVRVGDRAVTAMSGSYVIKPRNVPHTFWNPETRNARAIEMISPPDFANYFEELSQIIPPTGAPDEAREAELDRRYGLSNNYECSPSSPPSTNSRPISYTITITAISPGRISSEPSDPRGLSPSSLRLSVLRGASDGSGHSHGSALSSR